MGNSRHNTVIAEKKYFSEGEKVASKLNNRGPIRFDSSGLLSRDIIDAYKEYGWYVFQDVICRSELLELRADVRILLDHAPTVPDGKLDAMGFPCLGSGTNRNIFELAKPLSDPLGGQGRHEVKMEEYQAADEAPDYVVYKINSQLSLADSFLRLYGHPLLMRVTEAMNGSDFTPFAESIVVKQPGFGASVAWHQDGTTLWGSSKLDDHTHGFNFMAQLYGSTAENALWVVPGSHQKGKIDIRAKLRANGGDPRLFDAVPLIAGEGDIVICNRQTLHGSFANISPDLRVTLNFGFHRRSSVLGVIRRLPDGTSIVYDSDYITKSSRVISLAIDARGQKFPNEVPYRYQPLINQIKELQLTDQTRQKILNSYHDYQLPL